MPDALIHRDFRDVYFHCRVAPILRSFPQFRTQRRSFVYAVLPVVGFFKHFHCGRGILAERFFQFLRTCIHNDQFRHTVCGHFKDDIDQGNDHPILVGGKA
ncbi:MAG: hypothetical protein JEZ11_16030 [Desulfobacterales bacterium]|nr:hypothetical protein [Desulfobacterales bacterium]